MRCLDITSDVVRCEACPVKLQCGTKCCNATAPVCRAGKCHPDTSFDLWIPSSIGLIPNYASMTVSAIVVVSFSGVPTNAEGERITTPIFVRDLAPQIILNWDQARDY